MKLVGIILVVLGLAGGAFALNMDTSVEAGGQTYGSGSYSFHVPETRVNNLGLMDERRNYLYLSGLAILAGVILFGFGSIQTRMPTTSAIPPQDYLAQALKVLDGNPDPTEAIRRLEQIIEKFPGSASAEEARAYLYNLRKDSHWRPI